MSQGDRLPLIEHTEREQALADEAADLLRDTQDAYDALVRAALGVVEYKAEAQGSFRRALDKLESALPDPDPDGR